MGLEPATSESLVRDLTTTPPSHRYKNVKSASLAIPELRSSNQYRRTQLDVIAVLSTGITKCDTVMTVVNLDLIIIICRHMASDSTSKYHHRWQTWMIFNLYGRATSHPGRLVIIPWMDLVSRINLREWQLIECTTWLCGVQSSATAYHYQLQILL